MEIRFAHDDIERFIRKLEKPTIAKVLRTIDLLETFGHRLGMPHSKSIDAHLFELRVRGVQDVSLLYTFHDSVVIILHGFVKKTDRIPSKELSLAMARKRDLEET
jgi:phage-related protein